MYMIRGASSGRVSQPKNVGCWLRPSFTKTSGEDGTGGKGYAFPKRAARLAAFWEKNSKLPARAPDVSLTYYQVSTVSKVFVRVR